MRGTAFVVFEVMLWMAAALLIGVVIGWLIRGWRSEQKLRAAVEATHAAGVAGQGDLAARLAAAEARVAEVEQSGSNKGESDPDEPVDSPDGPRSPID